MKLLANIEYRTSWGESLCLCIGTRKYPMSYAGDGVWEVEIEKIALKDGAEYSYEVIRDAQPVRSEWKKHRLVLPQGPA